MKSRLFLFLLMVLPAALASAASEESAGSDLLVIGRAAVSGENLAAARQSAIGSALRRGVETELAGRMGSAALTDGFERIVKEVLPKATDLVEGYTILEETVVDGGMYVLVKLRVNGAMMEKALGEAGLEVQEDAPLKVLFMVSEKRNGDAAYWWKDPGLQPPLDSTEILLHQAFQTLGYDPVNRMTAFAGKEIPLEMRTLNLQPSDLYRWGALFGAELVVYGNSDIRSAESVSLELSVYDVQRRSLAADALVSEKIGGPEKPEETDLDALDTVVEKVVSDLQQDLSGAYGGASVEVEAFEVTLEGFSSYSDVNGFKSFLMSGVPGVQSVTPSRAGRDSVGYEVRFRGNATELLSVILRSPNQPFPMTGELRSEGALLFTARPSLGHE